MTPFEVLYGRKPDVRSLRVFGSTCFTLSPKDERRKLDEVARKCVLLDCGEAVNGFRLYDVIRKVMFFVEMYDLTSWIMA